MHSCQGLEHFQLRILKELTQENTDLVGNKES